MPDQLFSPWDVDALRSSTEAGAITGLKELFPIANERYELDLNDLRFTGRQYSKKDEYEAAATGRTLGRNLRGKWILKDKETGKVVDEQDRLVMTLPYLTNRGTWVYRGSDYVIANQFRLKPGIYTRMAQNGMLDATFNVKRGRGFKVTMDPGTGVFRLNIGQSQLKLYPLLKAMGLSDEEIGGAVGQEVLKHNIDDTDPRALSRAAKSLFKDTDLNNIGQRLIDYFGTHEINPELAEVGVGRADAHVNPQVFLSTIKRLVELDRGDAEYAPRDAIYARELYTPADQIRTRLAHDSGFNAGKLLWQVTNKGNLTPVAAGAFSPVVKSLLFRSGIASVPPEVNPMEIYDHLARVVSTGEYAIRGGHAAPKETHLLQPSEFMFLDGIRSPESEAIGLDSRFASAVKLDHAGNMYVPMRNARTGKTEYISNVATRNLTIGLPGQEKEEHPISIIRGVRQGPVSQDQVDYYPLQPNDMFAPVTNLAPLISGINPSRVMTASKYQIQAVPLVTRQAPLVQALVPGTDMSFEEMYGKIAGAEKSPVSGIVTSVSNDSIKVQDAKGKTHTVELYNKHPMNRISFLHQMPRVMEGQAVKEGDVIASSNYTDDKGTLALGANLRVAFIPSGDTYEDAAYISEDAAKKMTSSHMYPKTLDDAPGVTVGRKSFISLYPGKYTTTQTKNIDDDGLIKQGSVVNPGDPLILAYERQTTQPYYYKLRRGVGEYKDASVTWEKPWTGTITDARKTRDGWQVFVEAEAPAEQADKIGLRAGAKHVIAKILPTEEMPKDANGQPMDLVISPLAFLTRKIPALMAEAYLGKAAAKRGQPYKVPAFMSENMMEYAVNQLKENGLEPDEKLYDPKTDRWYSNPMSTGTVYVLKLMHMTSSKTKGREVGAGYTAEGLPSRGGDSSAKKFGGQAFNAVLSHGATDVISDFHLIKGAKNDDYWRAFRLGYTPAMPKVPYIHRKLFDMMKASGINVERTNGTIEIMPMTDKAVDEVSGGPIRSSAMLESKSLKPIAGGLFDPTITQGPGGGGWGHIELPIKVPNPVATPIIASLLGIPVKQVQEIVAGTVDLGGKTGSSAIEEALSRLSAKTEIAQIEGGLKSMNKTTKDKAIKELNSLRMMDKYGISPQDLMMSKIPVVPPAARPISRVKDMTIISDPNQLYKDLIDLVNIYGTSKGKIPADILKQTEGEISKAVSAVMGFGEPVTRKSREKKLQGIIGLLFAGSRKRSLLMDKVIGRPAEPSGLAVITPNSKLDMDHIGLPIRTAWEVYKPFVIRRLVQDGMLPIDAVRHSDDEDSVAHNALLRVFKERPVIANRAPTLHKFGMMSFWPVLSSGETIEVSPVVTKGFGANFDGDSCMAPVLVGLKANFRADFCNQIQNSLNNSRSVEYTTCNNDSILFKEQNMFDGKIVGFDGFSLTALNIEDLPHEAEPFEVTAKGTKRYKVPEGLYVPSVNPKTMQEGMFRVLEFSEHPNCSVYKVKFMDREGVAVSSDHSLLCVNKDLELEKVKPAKAVGLLAPRLAKIDLPEVIKSVMVGDRDVALDFDFGYLLGLVVGDGWINGNTINLCGVDKQIQEFFNQYVHMFNGSPEKCAAVTKMPHEFNGHSCYSERISITSTDLAAFIKTQIGHGAQNKHFPSFTFTAPKEFKLGILSGYIATDGTSNWVKAIAKKKPQYLLQVFTSSLRLAEDFEFLMFSLGVSAGVTLDREYYNVNVSTCDLGRAKLALKIGAGTKQENYEEFLSTYEETSSTTRFDIVPAPKHMLRTLRSKLTVKDDKHIYDRLSDALADGKGSDEITYLNRFAAKTVIDRFAGLDDPLFIRWKGVVANEALRWKYIRYVMPLEKKETLYDISVEIAESFATASGLILEDTMLYHVPVSNAAVKDAEKMLPSNNIYTTRSMGVHYVPQMEFLQGLNLATTKSDKFPRIFASKADAIKAYKRGEITIDQPIKIV